jgi:H+/Cl- antiporter ClcA
MCRFFVLAYAEQQDTGGAALQLPAVFFGIVLAVCILTFILFALARRRNHRQAEAIIAFAVLWGVITTGSLVWTFLALSKWSKEHATLLNTGYLDPRDMTGKPQTPWPLWIALLVVYGGLLIFALSQRNAAIDDSDDGFKEAEIPPS